MRLLALNLLVGVSSQEFDTKSEMQHHSKAVHRCEEKHHKCPLCLKSFPTSQQLAQHALVHSNMRRYPCGYCDKAFKQLSHVQQHQRIHTGMSVWLSVCLAVWLAVRLSGWLCVCLSSCLSVYVSVCPCVCVFVYIRDCTPV